jgi:hypothetical protein
MLKVKNIRINYSLRSILLFVNMDICTTKMCLDTSTLAKSIMGRREYLNLTVQARPYNYKEAEGMMPRRKCWR